MLESRAALIPEQPRQEQQETIPPLLFPEHQKNAAIQEDLRTMPLVKLRRALPSNLQKLPPEPLDTVMSPPKPPAGEPMDNSPGFVTS
jgi:hypothetical protein